MIAWKKKPIKEKERRKGGNFPHTHTPIAKTAKTVFVFNVIMPRGPDLGKC